MPLFVSYILLGILSLCFAVHLVYWCFGSFRLAFSPLITPPTPIWGRRGTLITQFPPVSVIICARNEEANLKKNLKLILEQDYPVFEVVVIDDCSWDGTLDVLKEFEKEYSKLSALSVKEDNIYKHSKKLSLTIGIKGAQYEYLVFTDADCYPSSKDWLKKMMEGFTPSPQQGAKDIEIMLGYGAYSNKKGMLNKLIRMDTFRIGLQYLSFAAAGAPYMGIGRNLAYRKSLFLKQKGFSPHSQIPSGDDDLFVNKSATRYNTRIAVSKDCITISEPKNTFGDWVKQKRRHVSTAGYYNSTSKFLLGTLTLSQYFFWLTSVALLFSHDLWKISVAVIGVYLILQLIIYRKVMNQLGEKDLFVYSLFLEWFILFIFYPVVTLSNLLYKQVVWKT